ncbi:phosphorylase family protein [Chitinilyticum litopenaei]|uniref:phosphorylase family protein n=1 Tax=Chitinilyticum litopenaei TaxID=1121276 RepID=UPI0003FA0C05|nr:purine phosphorylase [Chitinilyticum litopenaei]
MNITVLFPTVTEARCLSRSDVDVAVCGVGLVQAAHATTKLILQQRPDWLILAGIAGVYPGSALKIGDVVLVASEREADLGFYGKTGFTHLADLDIDMEFSVRRVLHCPWLPAQPPLPLASSNSLNVALAPFVAHAGVDVENMEGAAFFHACLQEEQRFLEVRAVSNRVTLDDEAWDFQASLHALGQGLNRVIDHLLATPGNR